MLILGIDPGYAIVGYGIINFDSKKYSYIKSGAIFTSSKDVICRRLDEIFNDLTKIIKVYKPDAFAIEKLYFQNNQKTAINVAEARGVILLAAQKLSIPIYEYTPLQIKSSITGYGKAQKSQVMMMTKMLLKLNEMPKPDDVADALAVAICHANCSNSLVYS